VLPLARTILQAQGRPVTIAPCTVTQITPLLVTVNGGTNIPAVKIAGATYALGQANALLCPPNQPIILPIG
jgi:hypothetical protein